MSINWKLEAAKLEFGYRDREALPDLACDAIMAGSDSDLMIKLAGWDKNDFEGIENCFVSVLNELNIVYPSDEDTTWVLMGYYMDQIISNEIDLIEGLRVIIEELYDSPDSSESIEKYVGDTIEIHVLYGMLYTYEDLSAATYPWSLKKSNEVLLSELKTNIKEEVIKYRNGYLAKKLLEWES